MIVAVPRKTKMDGLWLVVDSYILYNKGSYAKDPREPLRPERTSETLDGLGYDGLAQRSEFDKFWHHDIGSRIQRDCR